MLYDCHRRRAPHWWLWVIIFVPFGALAYFVVVKLPTLKTGALIRRKPGVAERRHAFDTSPSLSNRLALAEALCDAGEFDEARTHFRAVLDSHADDKDAIYGLGVASMALQDYEEAIASFSHITREHRNFRDWGAWSLLAEAFWLKDDRENSLHTLEELNRFNPRLEHQVILARCYLQMNEENKAQQLLETALRDFDASPAHVKKANRQFVREAESTLRRLQKRSPRP